uniref:Acyltransferase n=1 Tax=Coccolithus braarudii TaxID=221442 RepID=A0A7S0PXT3_9EUKA
MAALNAPTRSFVQSTSFERTIGFLAACPFTLVYVLAPLYVLAALTLLLLFPLNPRTWLLLAPLIVSLALPPWVAVQLSPYIMGNWASRQIPKYFAYEEYHEATDQELQAAHAEGKRFLLVAHPHGVFSFCGVCGFIASMCASDGIGASLPIEVPTAAASVICFFPFLKDVLGVFGVIDASGSVLNRRLSRNRGSVVLYVGGIAELFASSPAREAVYLKKRKGFIKLALRTGADVLPVYFFGNTTVLSVLTAGPLAMLSRNIGVSVTLFWGRFFLPVPKPVKLVYARGRPLGLPHIEKPTDADVDEWHAKYCAAVKELFDAYKGKNPDYAQKELEIM